ncbi:Tn3 family transposase [Streptomyces sp. NPDC001027]|uniref:Tn3 family transposase n=1 Tax=Streptomyces sp. NPDC001027 TaxID=3154771 RepID=UPI003330DEF4
MPPGESVRIRVRRPRRRRPAPRRSTRGLQIVENWNSANNDLFYGKDGDLAGQPRNPRRCPCSPSTYSSSALVHVNTLLMQQVLADPKRADTLTAADRRSLPPLFWTHVHLYGRFELDMNSRLDLDLTARYQQRPDHVSPRASRPPHADR